MKIRQMLLVCIAITAAHFCSAQVDSSAVKTKTPVFKPSLQPAPLVVLKSDERTLELDPMKNEEFNFDAIETKWIKSITVLKGENARREYGERGADGVLIVQLADNYIFSKPTLIKFQIKN